MELESFVKEMMHYASTKQVSDIYVLPNKETYTISMRFHYFTKPYAQLSLEDGEQCILYFKFLGGMDVGEHRRPQLGSCTLDMVKTSIRLRLSTVSNYRHQETLVIRLLYSLNEKQLYFFNQKEFNKTNQLIRTKGLHLFCGPVGSGKTTTMYSILKNNIHSHQIITIEDPVEIEEEHFLQLQIHPAIHVDYDELIKLCLRHRPDFLMIGEIRDENTAHYAFRAALTGHCVLATLHAPSFAGVRQRLYDLGVTPTEVKQVLKTITLQRILPIYCPYCHGVCHPYCTHYAKNYRCFMITEKEKEGRRHWNATLRQAWLNGAITKETWQEERIEEE